MNVAGIEIPSNDPIFLEVVLGIHIPLGLTCAVIGLVAMFSKKGRGQHSTCGKIYFWCLLALALSATYLSLAHWAENYHLFVLGILSFALVWFGRTAMQRHWPYGVRLHITGMGLSYIVLLVAFYVDNGKQLPLWRNFPHFTYWLLPLAFGLPLVIRALLWHPLARKGASAQSN